MTALIIYGQSFILAWKTGYKFSKIKRMYAPTLFGETQPLLYIRFHNVPSTRPDVIVQNMYCGCVECSIGRPTTVTRLMARQQDVRHCGWRGNAEGL